MKEGIEKQYYKIKEVSEMLGVPQSTLRFWEKEFPTLIKPRRSAHNLRYYSLDDIEKLRMILYLIKDKGLKIDAARAYLRSNAKNVSTKMEVIDSLLEVREDLAAMLKALRGRTINPPKTLLKTPFLNKC